MKSWKSVKTSSFVLETTSSGGIPQSPAREQMFNTWFLMKALPAFALLAFGGSAGAASVPKCRALFVAPGVSSSPLFNGGSILQLELQGDFNKVYKAAQGVAGDPAPKTDASFYAPAVLKDLTHPERSLTAQIRGRGMSSLYEGEASFPKLKVEIAKTEKLDGALFDNARNFRINTHVSTNPKKARTALGLLNSELSPWREGLAYELARRLGILAPATRLARIHYIDSVSKKDFTRNALLVETDKNIAERLQMPEAPEPDFRLNEKSGIDPVVGAKFHLFHKLIGNDDVNLRVNEEPVQGGDNYRVLFNASIFKAQDGQILPMVYDLDKATVVSGYETLSGDAFKNTEFKLLKPAQAIFVTKFLALRQKFTQAQLSAAIADFKARKQDLYAAVKNARVDEAGRTNATLHLDTFFANVDAPMALPVLATPYLQFYKDAAKSGSKLNPDPITEEAGTLRAGTPVQILGKENGLLKVAIIDINSDLASGESPVGYIEATAVVSPTLPDSFIGPVDQRDVISR
jgi:hypothetical protein